MEQKESPAGALQLAERLLIDGRVAEGIAAAEAAAALCEARGDPAQRARCQRLLAVGYTKTGQLRDAVAAGYRAIALHEGLPAPAALAHSLSLTAVAVVRAGDTAEALDLIARTLAVMPRIDDPAAELRIWNNLSVAYEALDDLPRTGETLQYGLDAARRQDDPALLALLNANYLLYGLRVARAAGTRPAIDDALAALAAHVDACERGAHHFPVACMADPMGEALIEIGRLDEAQALLVRGLAAARAAGLGPEQARLDLRFARLERTRARLGEAMAYLDLALRAADAGGERDLIAQCHLERSELFEALGDTPCAFASYKRYTEITLAALRAQAEVRAQVLKFRLESVRAHFEAEMLKMRNAELREHIDVLEHRASRLARDASEDPLTGLGNRRYFQHAAATLREAASASGRQPALVLIDIDHFKRINDTWSHAVGDAVLREIGHLFRSLCRPADVVVRLGGEEFVLAFVAVDPADGPDVAERMRSAVATHDWGSIREALSVTVSAGVALWQESENLDAALHRADAALYEAKRSGRNRVRLAGSPAGEPGCRLVADPAVE